MDQLQQASFEVAQKFALIQLNETDDEISRQESPAFDKRISECIGTLPQILQQKLDYLKTEGTFQILQQPDDSVYYGQLEGNQKSGRGVCIWNKLGNLLEGTWKADQLEGLCRMSYANGDVFEGQFKAGNTCGFGIFQTQKKIVKGMWLNNMIQGEGQELRSDGTKYYGQFVKGKKEGRGIMFFSDGSKYEGMFKNNKFHGDGIFLWNDNSQYQGQFQKGLILGMGCYTNNNNLQLIGQVFYQSKKFNEINQSISSLQRILFMNQYNQSLVIEKISPLRTQF